MNNFLALFKTLPSGFTLIYSVYIFTKVPPYFANTLSYILMNDLIISHLINNNIVNDFFLFITLLDKGKICFVAIIWKALVKVFFSCRVKMDAEKATVALKEVKACCTKQLSI